MGDHSLDKHLANLHSLCRICGRSCKTKGKPHLTPSCVANNISGIQMAYGVHVVNDSADVHSKFICKTCHGRISYIKNYGLSSAIMDTDRRMLFESQKLWAPFNGSIDTMQCTICHHHSSLSKGGRPKKPGRRTMLHDVTHLASTVPTCSPTLEAAEPFSDSVDTVGSISDSLDAVKPISDPLNTDPLVKEEALSSPVKIVEPFSDPVVKPEPFPDPVEIADPLSDPVMKVEPLSDSVEPFSDLVVKVEPFSDPVEKTETRLDPMEETELFSNLVENIESFADPVVKVEPFSDPVVKVEPFSDPVLTEETNIQPDTATQAKYNTTVPYISWETKPVLMEMEDENEFGPSNMSFTEMLTEKTSTTPAPYTAQTNLETNPYGTLPNTFRSVHVSHEGESSHTALPKLSVPESHAYPRTGFTSVTCETHEYRTPFRSTEHRTLFGEVTPTTGNSGENIERMLQKSLGDPLSEVEEKLFTCFIKRKLYQATDKETITLKTRDPHHSLDKHLANLHSLCRICGLSCNYRTRRQDFVPPRVANSVLEIQMAYGIYVVNDNAEVHSKFLCKPCYKRIFNIKRHGLTNAVIDKHREMLFKSQMLWAPFDSSIDAMQCTICRHHSSLPRLGRPKRCGIRMMPHVVKSSASTDPTCKNTSTPVELLSDPVVKIEPELFSDPVVKTEPKSDPVKKMEPFSDPVEKMEPFSDTVEIVEPFFNPVVKTEQFSEPVEKIQPFSDPVVNIKPFSDHVVKIEDSVVKTEPFSYYVETEETNSQPDTATQATYSTPVLYISGETKPELMEIEDDNEYGPRNMSFTEMLFEKTFTTTAPTTVQNTLSAATSEYRTLSNFSSSVHVSHEGVSSHTTVPELSFPEFHAYSPTGFTSTTCEANEYRYRTLSRTTEQITFYGEATPTTGKSEENIERMLQKSLGDPLSEVEEKLFTCFIKRKLYQATDKETITVRGRGLPLTLRCRYHVIA